MTLLLDELKTRARLRLNAQRPQQPQLRLRQCLVQVAQDVGFAHWEHARRVLGGTALPGEDMGSFWHAPRCDSLLNAWFADLPSARQALAAQPRMVLLAYRRQFVLAGEAFIRELGLDPQHAAWAAAEHDLVMAYGGQAWLALAAQRLQAPAASFARR